MKIISPRRTVETVTYERAFWNRHRTSGFGFPCDEHGNVDTSKFGPEGHEHLRACLAGEYSGLVDHGVVRQVSTYRQAAIGRCDCGAEVELDGFTNTCESCGADYNSAGQRLAPREQWGEETQENLAMPHTPATLVDEFQAYLWPEVE